MIDLITTYVALYMFLHCLLLFPLTEGKEGGCAIHCGSAAYTFGCHANGTRKHSELVCSQYAIQSDQGRIEIPFNDLGLQLHRLAS